jgi:hypothetical protein
MKPRDAESEEFEGRIVISSSKVGDAFANLISLVTVVGALCAPAVVLQVWIWGWPW